MSALAETKVGDVLAYWGNGWQRVPERITVTSVTRTIVRCDHKDFHRSGISRSGGDWYRGYAKPWTQEHSDICSKAFLSKRLNDEQFDKFSLPQLRQIMTLVDEIKSTWNKNTTEQSEATP